MSSSSLDHRLSRRVFLEAAALFTASAAVVSAAPTLQFPKEPRQRLAVTSYPFRTFLESPTNPARDKSKPGMDMKEFPAMIAKRFNVHNINPLGAHFSSLGPGYLEEFRKALSDAKSHIVDLGLGGQDFGNADKAAQQKAIDFTRKWLDIAVLAGSPSVRQHLGAPKGATPSVPHTVETLSRLSEYAAKKNVVVNLENDAPVAEDPFFIAEVVDKVNNPYIRALPDFGNSLRGHDAEYNKKAVDGMFKHVFNICHVKNILRGKDGKEFKVDLPGMFAVARAHKFDGYFSMEFDTGAGDPYEGTALLVKETLRYM